MRVDYETWHAMRLCFHLDQENNATLIFERVRIVKLFNGCYLACSCHLFTCIGVACVQIDATTNEISAHFLHTMHWKQHNFYYLREGTGNAINDVHDNFEFENKAPGAC